MTVMFIFGTLLYVTVLVPSSLRNIIPDYHVLMEDLPHKFHQETQLGDASDITRCHYYCTKSGQVDEKEHCLKPLM